MSNDYLEWEITPQEKRDIIRKSVKYIAVVAIIYAVVAGGGFLLEAIAKEGPKTAIFFAPKALLGVLITYVLIYVVSYLVPFKKRKYHLDDSGISVTKGRKEGFFEWNLFEEFYPYKEALYGENKDIKKLQGQLGYKDRPTGFEGKVFYLKFKPKGFMGKISKTFLLVKTETHNSGLVGEFLSSRLQRKEMKPGTDLGMVFYKFK